MRPKEIFAARLTPLTKLKILFLLDREGVEFNFFLQRFADRYGGSPCDLPPLDKSAFQLGFWKWLGEQTRGTTAALKAKAGFVDSLFANQSSNS